MTERPTKIKFTCPLCRHDRVLTTRVEGNGRFVIDAEQYDNHWVVYCAGCDEYVAVGDGAKTEREA